MPKSMQRLAIVLTCTFVLVWPSQNVALAVEAVQAQPGTAGSSSPSPAESTADAGQDEAKKLVEAGIDSMRARDPARALTNFQQALDRYRQSGDAAGQALAVLGVGLANDALGEYGAATEAYQTALDFQQSQGDSVSAEVTLSNLGSAYLNVGDYDRASDSFRGAVSLARQRTDRQAEARYLNQLGRVSERLGLYAQAEDTFRQALDLATATGSESSVSSALNNLGVVSTHLGRYQEARQYVGRALEMSRAAGDRSGEATNLNNLGQVFELTGAFDEAERQYEEALRIEQELRDGPGEALTTNNLAVLAEKQGNYSRAQQLAEQALGAFRGFGDRASEAAAMDTLGTILLDLGRYEDALSYHDQSLSIRRAVGDHAGQAISLNNLGLISRTRGQPQKAIDYYGQALAIYRDVGDRSGVSTVLNNLGQAYRDLALYERALSSYEQALAIQREIGNRGLESTTLNNIGSVYLSLSLVEDGLAAYQQSLSIAREVGDRAGEARTINNIGTAYESLELRQEALELYGEALETVRELGDRSAEASVLNNLGSVSRALGDPAEAEARFLEMLALEHELGESRGEGIGRNNLGGVYADLGDIAAAADQYEMAIAIAEEIGDRELESAALGNLARLLEETGDPDRALSMYGQAIAVVEDVRGAVHVDELKTSLTGGTAALYWRAARLQLRMGRAEASFDLTERGRARTFLDQLSGGRVDVRQGASAALVEQEQRLRADLSALDRSLRDELAKPSVERRTELIESLFAEIEDQEEQYARLLTQIKLADPEYATMAGVDPLRLSEVQALLDEDTTLLSYFVGSDFTLGYTITSDGIVARELPVGDSDLRAMVGDRAFAQPRGSLDGLSALSDALIAPMRDALNTPVLAIIPHGVLHYVPFAALPDGDAFLGDRFLLADLPSASTLPFVQAKQRAAISPSSDTLALSPDFVSAQFPALPFADQEARFVARLFGSEALVGDAATEAALKRMSGQAAILHIASHGQYNARNPLFSRLILNPSDGEDGSLEVHEVYGLDLQDAGLVVLSACETDLGAQSEGDEIVGLTRAFIYAGAPSVISSLWTVNDRATALFMSAFYQSLQQGMDKAEAMRHAQQSVREEYAHPYYWAGFVLTGLPN